MRQTTNHLGPGEIVMGVYSYKYMCYGCKQNLRKSEFGVDSQRETQSSRAANILFGSWAWSL